ncbi:pyrimidine/purine nucleoside phosphorylase [Mucilaginibacter sp.]|uniref:pyrimidine/purine nucleoside phosphorylase n=1 Tax=Mucilaginibacter sp. TaxID=1882438 RepID=UPI003D0DE6CA
MSNPVIHNTYFEGQVQSLGLQTAKGTATVGVMKKGSYRFSTSSAETMVIIAGGLNVKLATGDWTAYNEQEKFEVAAGTFFDVSCETDVAYICYYA